MLQFLQSMPEERAFSLCDVHYDAKCSKSIILNIPLKNEEILTGISNKNIN